MKEEKKKQLEGARKQINLALGNKTRGEIIGILEAVKHDIGHLTEEEILSSINEILDES